MERLETVIDRVRINQRIHELGQQITESYQGKQLALIGVLNGAFVFLADLARAIDLPLEIDFIRVASYGKATNSSGSINLSKDIEMNLTGKHVLLVEDIVDTGLTMAWLARHMQSKKAATVGLCTLIDKLERRNRPINIDFAGFTLGSGFLVGYGLDYAEKYRNLPDICTIIK